MALANKWHQVPDSMVLELLTNNAPYLQMEIYNIILNKMVIVKRDFMYFYLFKTLLDSRDKINLYPYESLIKFLRVIPPPAHCLVRWVMRKKPFEEYVQPRDFLSNMLDFAALYNFDLDYLRLQKLW
jgi:hypothetical protein